MVCASDLFLLCTCGFAAAAASLLFSRSRPRGGASLLAFARGDRRQRALVMVFFSPLLRIRPRH